MEELNFCIEKLFYLPAIAGCENPPDDFFEAWDDGDLKKIMPWLDSYIVEGERSCREDMMQAIWDNPNNCEGFVARISTPVKRPFGNGGMAYSWGYCQFKWVLAKDINELMETGRNYAAIEDAA